MTIPESPAAVETRRGEPCVALARWCAGAWRAVAAFWLSNLVGTALVSLGIIWPLDAAGFAFAHCWATEPRPLRWVALAGMAAWLVLAIVHERHVWNIEHLGGYALGASLTRWRRWSIPFTTHLRLFP